MAHKAKDSQLPEFYYETLFFNRYSPNEIVRDIISEIVDRGAEIIFQHSIHNRTPLYAAQSLTTQIVHEMSCAFWHLDPEIVDCEPDEDLILPPTDEWATGSLPIRNEAAIGLRSAAPPKDESRVSRSKQNTPTEPSEPHTSRSLRPHVNAFNSIDRISPSNLGNSNNSNNNSNSPNDNNNQKSESIISPSKMKNSTKHKVKPPPSEAELILRSFDEARKKINGTQKNITVDENFQVIQIQEPKGLPPSLIVPRISTRKPEISSARPVKTIRTPHPVIKKPQTNNTKKKVRFFEADEPIIDKSLVDLSLTDKFICAPGVTIKEGGLTRTRPLLSQPNQMTREQYETYLKEMKDHCDDVPSQHQKVK